MHEKFQEETKKKRLLLIALALIVLMSGCVLVDLNEWMFGTWIVGDDTNFGSSILVLDSDYTYTMYDDYYQTTVSGSGSWDCDGDYFYMGVIGVPFEQITEDHFQTELITGYPTDYYRKSVYPIEITSISLDEGWVVFTIEDEEYMYFSFDATAGTTYEIQWDDDYDGTDTYDADIIVAAYESDHETTYFTSDDSGYTYPAVITPAEDGAVYIEIRTFAFSNGGTAAIQVYEQP
ncbi:MAG: hypothetical protein JW874_01435 [Spirochaetales bacterium]|nr:hypothetical protein [Spirochaetales bacterium]